MIIYYIILYYINNNVNNDNIIPLLNYIKTIEKKWTEAGNLEISSEANNYGNICIYTKSYIMLPMNFIIKN